MREGPLAAIWARVSTQGQMEMSLDSQEAAVRQVLGPQGFTVLPEHVLKVDWTSMDLMACPPFQQLRQWVTDGVIQAVGVLDRDRLQAQGLQRLVFMSECQEHKVQIIAAQGPAMMEGPEGQLVELALALGKEKSVLRAQQGAKDGLRDRAKLKGLPATGKCPYGYQLRYETRYGADIPMAFEPQAPEHFIAERIWKACLKGHPIRRICRDLMADGVPAPKGGSRWAPATVFGILKNPVYGGRYYALRRERVTPKERRGDTYGHSSSTSRPLDEAELLDFPVISPIVSWEEWESVQARLALNKQESKRNSQRVYLLSGMAFCAQDGRRLSPYSPKGRNFYYACSLRRGNAMGVEPCGLKQVNGAQLESAVWDSVSAFLENPKVFMAEVDKQRGEIGQVARESVETRIEGLRRKIQAVEGKEGRLAGLLLADKVTETTFEGQSALLRAERTYHQDEIDRQEAVLSAMEDSDDALDAMVNVRDRIAAKLGNATPEDRRWVLQGLATRVEVGDTTMVSIGTNPIDNSVLHTRVLRLASCTYSPVEPENP